MDIENIKEQLQKLKIQINAIEDQLEETLSHSEKLAEEFEKKEKSKQEKYDEEVEDILMEFKAKKKELEIEQKREEFNIYKYKLESLENELIDLRNDYASYFTNITIQRNKQIEEARNKFYRREN